MNPIDITKEKDPIEPTLYKEYLLPFLSIPIATLLHAFCRHFLSKVLVLTPFTFTCYVVFLIGVPVIFALRLILKTYRSRWDWALSSLLLYAYLSAIYIIHPWPISFGFFIRKSLLIFVSVMIALSYWKNASSFSKSGKTHYYLNFFKLVAIGTIVYSLAPVFKMKNSPKDEITLGNPFKKNHVFDVHTDYEKFVYGKSVHPSIRHTSELVLVDRLGRKYKRWIPKSKEDVYVYGHDVYSPVSGYVTHIKMNLPDSKNGFKSPRPGYVTYTKTDSPDLDSRINDPFKGKTVGNYLVIQTGDHIVVLANLGQNSSPLKKGDFVEKGQFIGQVGSSATAIVPFLYVAVYSSNKSSHNELESLPFRLEKH